MGSEFSATCVIWFDLKPTISKLGNFPNTSGRCLNLFCEAKITLSFVSCANSAGNDDKALLDKSRISKLSARVKISSGNSVKFSESFN